MIKINSDNKIIILFDGVCNMCVWIVQFIIKRDNKDIFRFASLQSNLGKEYIQLHSLNMNSIIIVKNGQIKKQSSAVLSILFHLNTYWKFLIIFYIIPYPLRDLVYLFISKTRYYIFGKREKCMVPDDYIKSKFLSL